MAISWPIAEYMNVAAIECAVPRPGSWLLATGTNEVLMRTLLDDTVRELVRRVAWAQITYSSVLNGTGDESFGLPADFYRIADGDNAVYENTPNRRPCKPITSNGDWAELKQLNFAGIQRFYRLTGNTIDFFRPLPSGGVVTISYVSKNWKTDSTGVAPGNSWANDGDLSLVPGHLLQLGVIWRFRRHQGLQYLDRKVEYEAELARAISDDRPTGKVVFDAVRPSPRNPFDLPVPDYIPPA